MYYFHLSSLIQPCDSLQPINPDNYALVMSPSLSSIAVLVHDFKTNSKVDYTEEAVMSMVARMAPNLAHVWLIQMRVGESLQPQGGRSFW
jgi:hypothetical protein